MLHLSNPNLPKQLYFVQIVTCLVIWGIWLLTFTFNKYGSFLGHFYNFFFVLIIIFNNNRVIIFLNFSVKVRNVRRCCQGWSFSFNIFCTHISNTIICIEILIFRFLCLAISFWNNGLVRCILFNLNWFTDFWVLSRVIIIWNFVFLY